MDLFDNKNITRVIFDQFYIIEMEWTKMEYVTAMIFAFKI